MMDTDLLPRFTVVCLIIEATPGPNMGYLAVLTMQRGMRAGVMTVAGIAAGLAMIGLAAALGVSGVLIQFPAVYHILRYVCVLYLLWIAYGSWKEETEASPDRVQVPAEARYFRHGFVINVLNPKAAVFYMSMLPGFITPGFPALQQTLLLTAISVSIATLAHLLIVGMAGRLAASVNSRQRRVFRKIMAVLLAGVAVWFAF